MLSPNGDLNSRGFSYSLDNGAWAAFKNNQKFDDKSFIKALLKKGSDADFIVLPDIVAGGNQSLSLSSKWLKNIYGDYPLLLLPVQDGITEDKLQEVLDRYQVGIFIGGTSFFKEKTLPRWKSYKRYVHCGRVNTKRRLLLAKFSYVDSFDGSGPSRYLKHAKVMNSGLQQGVLPFQGGQIDVQIPTHLAPGLRPVVPTGAAFTLETSADVRRAR